MVSAPVRERPDFRRAPPWRRGISSDFAARAARPLRRRQAFSMSRQRIAVSQVSSSGAARRDQLIVAETNGLPRPPDDYDRPPKV